MYRFHRVESLYAAGYIYRDIKPNSFLLATGKQDNMVYMIGYKLAILSEGITQPSYEPQACSLLRMSLVGNCRYASHLRVAICRHCI